MTERELALLERAVALLERLVGHTCGPTEPVEPGEAELAATRDTRPVDPGGEAPEEE